MEAIFSTSVASSCTIDGMSLIVKIISLTMHKQPSHIDSHKDENYTKGIFQTFKIDENYKNTPRLAAGISIIFLLCIRCIKCEIVYYNLKIQLVTIFKG
jgi:hypothetical protein